MQQIYKRTPMPKCDFSKVALQLYRNHTLAWAFSCEFAACFRTPFLRNTSRWLLLYWLIFVPTKIQQLSPLNLVTHSMPPISIYTPWKYQTTRRTTWIFVFTLLCVASKGFMKVLKTLKSYKTPKRSVKINI